MKPGNCCLSGNAQKLAEKDDTLHDLSTVGYGKDGQEMPNRRTVRVCPNFPGQPHSADTRTGMLGQLELPHLARRIPHPMKILDGTYILVWYRDGQFPFGKRTFLF